MILLMTLSTMFTSPVNKIQAYHVLSLIIYKQLISYTLTHSYPPGGKIDHSHHAANAKRAMIEVLALSDAVQTALDLTSEDDTLVVNSIDS